MITIDATEFIQGLENLTQQHLEAITGAMVGVAEIARQEILAIAERDLSKRAYEEYSRGMDRPLDIQPGEVTLTLDGKYPNDLESGFRAYDMKPGLLKGKPYADIPMDFSKSQKAKPHEPPPLSPEAARSLKQAVDSAKKNLASGSGKFKVRGGKFPAEKTDWTTSKYSSAIQEVTIKKGRVSTQSNPTTIRRVSLKSAESSWIHPELSEENALGAFKKVEPIVREQLEKALKAVLERT